MQALKVWNNTFELCDYGIVCSLYGQYYDIWNNTFLDHINAGIRVWRVTNSTIRNNNFDNTSGIVFQGDDENMNYNVKVTNNTLLNNHDCGIYLYDASGIDFHDNTLTGAGFLVKECQYEGQLVEYWNTHKIPVSNVLNGQPILYWKDQIGGVMPAGYAQYILANCTNVVVENMDLSFYYAPIQMGHCDNVIVRGVTVQTTGPNGDGLNPDSCRNVLVEGCTFDTGDDCIAINSGMNEDGWRVGIPCENIHIQGCTMREGHGAISIGSGMSGGVRNLYAHDCTVTGGDQGIRLKSMRGRGGFIENVYFENFQLSGLLGA